MGLGGFFPYKKVGGWVAPLRLEDGVPFKFRSPRLAGGRGAILNRKTNTYPIRLYDFVQGERNFRIRFRHYVGSFVVVRFILE